MWALPSQRPGGLTGFCWIPKLDPVGNVNGLQKEET